jgi:tetratricopeptide (TPR) repeat protein
MKIEKPPRTFRGWSFCALLVLLTGCGPGFYAGNDVAQGRQAMFKLDYQGALGHFQSAVQTDPGYIYGTALREGTLSFFGRAQYLTGRLEPARGTLQKAVAQHPDDHLARLYLGLTLARLGDRPSGVRDIEAGMTGIRDFLNYITTAFSGSFGQFWDPTNAIRNAVAANLDLIQREGFDWPTLIANCEVLAMNFEQEPDRATHQEERDFQMNTRR